MKLLKRAAAVLLSVCTALTCASCGERTANAMTVDSKDIRAGIYLYYAVNAYSDAISELEKQGEKFDDVKTSKDYKNIVKNISLDGVSVEEWIQNKAEKYCKTFVNIEKEFESLGLKLSGEQIAAAEANAASSMNYYGDYFKNTGIGEESIKAVLLNSYKQDAVWAPRISRQSSSMISMPQTISAPDLLICRSRTARAIC